MTFSQIRKQMLLQSDRLRPSSESFRAYRGGVALTNDDGTFPRVKRLSDSQRLVVPGASEEGTIYQVRIVSNTLPAIAGVWQISVDGGAVKLPVKAIGNAFRDAGGNAWVVNLEHGV